MTATLGKLCQHLDEYLRIEEVPDSATAFNGLQVENGGTVGRIVAAVDASQATIESVVAAQELDPSQGSTLLLVHHGLFWDGAAAVTGRRYRRLRTLLEHDVAVYSAHIPLDVHPELGNNILLARLLELADPVPFGDWKGVALGYRGRRAMLRQALADLLADQLSTQVRVIPGGPETTDMIGVITGGAGSQILNAAEAGCDTFVTGEGAHHTYFDAMEAGVNVLYAGHYATETLGVKALAAGLSDRFGLPWTFHDHPTGL